MYIHRQVGEGVLKLAAHPLAELDGGHGEALVRPLGLHLEAVGGGEGLLEIGPGGLEDGFLILAAGQGPGHGDDAEDPAAGGVGRLHVALVRQGLHIDGTLLGVDVELAAPADPAADVGNELVLKAAAVEALEDHLAQLQKQHLPLGDGWGLLNL